MKNKLIALSLLGLVLAGCGEVEEPTEDLKPVSVKPVDEEPVEKEESVDKTAEAEDNYIAEIVPIFDSYANTMNTFSEVTNRPSQDPSLFFDEGYLSEVDAVTDEMLYLIGLFENIESPSPRFDEFHHTVSEAFEYHKIVAEGLPETVRSLDAEGMLNYVDLMNLGNREMEKANSLLAGLN
jgi:hypothetical protein